MNFILHRLNCGTAVGRSYGYIWSETPNIIRLWLVLDKPMEEAG